MQSQDNSDDKRHGVNQGNRGTNGDADSQPDVRKKEDNALSEVGSVQCNTTVLNGTNGDADSGFDAQKKEGDVLSEAGKVEDSQPDAPQEDELPPEAQGDWCILAATCIGKHTPCQDSHAVKRDLANNWGIAVVCDGAGSSSKADVGAQFVAKETASLMHTMLQNTQWHVSNTLPEPALWQEMATQVLAQVLQRLEDDVRQRDYTEALSAFNCTVIAAIYAPHAVLIAHIGDGRACYRTQDGVWRAMMTPFHTQNGGTAFLPTPFVWQAPTAFIETRVIDEPITAFALLSDGCEDQTYLVKQEFPLIQKWLDVNTPYDGFWEKVYQHYLAQIDAGVSAEVLSTTWQEMLQHGAHFAEERDDKTIVMGIYAQPPTNDTVGG